MNFFKKEICFCNLPECDIIIYNESHSELIVKYILNGHAYFIYPMIPEKIFINPLIIYYFLKSLSYFKFIEIKKRNDKIRAFFSQILFCYRVGTFTAINPKVVISMIDNSYTLHQIAKVYDRAQFFLIQNALRVNYSLKSDRKYYLPHYFSFGDYTRDVMNNYNHTIINHYPIGSFRLGIADKFLRSDSKNQYDIGIVSQYREGYLGRYIRGLIPKSADGVRYANDNEWIEHLEAQVSMHKLLSKYIIESGKSAAMIMASDFNTEVEFYKNYYTEGVEFIPRIPEKLNSFDVLFRCNIVVAFFSSLSIEAFGIGRKILRIDCTDSDNWNDYDSKILIRKPSYDELKDRLEKLFDEPYDNYRKRTKKYASYLMNYKPDFPPHEFMRKKIEEYL